MQNTKLKVLSGRVAVEPIKEAKSFLAIPETARQSDTHIKGTVVAVAPDNKDLKVGDKVLISDLIGARLNIPDRDIRVYLAEDILARFEPT